MALSSACQSENSVPAQNGHSRNVEDVRPECGQASVLEKQRLRDKNSDHSKESGQRSEQNGEKRTPHQVA